eukprot:1426542-Ditylum_brightwellii.AAC.1
MTRIGGEPWIIDATSETPKQISIFLPKGKEVQCVNVNMLFGPISILTQCESNTFDKGSTLLTWSVNRYLMLPSNIALALYF